MYQLLMFVALSGEFPTGLVNLLPGAETYKAKAITRLKRTRWVNSYYDSGLRGLRLTATAKRELLRSQADTFGPILSGKNSISTPKYDVPNRLRLHRMAEILIMMYRAGAVVFPWEKPGVFLPDDRFLPATITKPTYYSSIEVKGIGKQATMIRNSRATGLLLTPDNLFAVYNTADGEMKWEFQSEMRLKVLIQQDICYQRLPDQYGPITPEAIVVSTDMRQLPALLSGQRKGQKPFVIGNEFPHFHYLTMDHHGEVILQILCSSERKGKLDMILTSDLAPRRHYLTENDGFDETGAPVLLAYSCDIPRIHRFYTGLLTNRLSGSMICFDFQEEALREICGDEVSFTCVDFDEFERRVFNIPP